MLRFCVIAALALAAGAFCANVSEAGGRGFVNRQFSFQAQFNRGFYGNVGAQFAGYNVGAQKVRVVRTFAAPSYSYSYYQAPAAVFAAPAYSGCGGGVGAAFNAGGYGGGGVGAAFQFRSFGGVGY